MKNKKAKTQAPTPSEQIKNIEWHKYISLPLLLFFTAVVTCFTKFAYDNWGLLTVWFLFILFFVIFVLGWWALLFKVVHSTLIPFAVTLIVVVICWVTFPNISGTKLHFWFNRTQYELLAQGIAGGSFDEEFFYPIISGKASETAYMHSSFDHLAFPQLAINRSEVNGTVVEFENPRALFNNFWQTLFFVEKDQGNFTVETCRNIYPPLSLEKLTDNWYLCTPDRSKSFR